MKMHSSTLSTGLVLYAIFLGQTPLIHTAFVDWPSTVTTTGPPSINDTSNYDDNSSSSTTPTTGSYYGDPWSVTTNATTTTTEGPRNGRPARRTSNGIGRTSSNNDRNNDRESRYNDTMRQGHDQSTTWDPTSATASDFDFTDPMYANETWNLTTKEVRELSLYVLPNGTTVYSFPNGTFANSSSITFPNATVITSFPNGTSVNTTTTSFPNGTTGFTFPNGTTLNSSEIFSLPNGTRFSYVEEVLMSDILGSDVEEGVEKDVTSSTRRPMTRRQSTTTTTSAPSSDGDAGDRRPIRRKGSIPQPAPRTQNPDDVTTEINENRRKPGNWFG